MKMIPKSYLIKEIVDGIHESTKDFVEAEISMTYQTLLNKGVSKTLAQQIIDEVRLLL